MDKYVTTSNESLEDGVKSIPDNTKMYVGMSGEQRSIFKYRLHSWQKLGEQYHFVWELVKS